MTEILFSSAQDIIKGIKSKKFSAVEVMQEHLDRIKIVNPKINAIVQQLDPNEALAEAKKADEAVARGKILGKLQGLPITIKDATQVKGFSSSAGCPGLLRKANEDGTAVSRLRKEGAIIIGMTNVPELLLCPETDNAIYGQTKNPYDLTKSPGGSSGGEAAIIAAGGSALGLASDAGGSIRIPAHFTGIVGIKPTQGRVPITGGAIGDAPGIFTKFAVLGPLARFVDDLYLELEIIAGVDGKDPFAVPVPLKNPKDVDLKHLKVAYFLHSGYAEPPSEEVQKVVKEAAEGLKPYVAEVRYDHPEIIGKTVKLIWDTVFLGGDRGVGLRAFLAMVNVKEPSPMLAEFLRLADKIEFSVSELRNRLIAMDQFQIDMLKFMQPYDVLISPVVATVAKDHGKGLKEIDDFSYTMVHNLTGWPAAVVRCGTSKDGLPIGVQIVAKPWCDDVALAVAKKLEELFGGFIPPNI